MRREASSPFLCMHDVRTTSSHTCGCYLSAILLQWRHSVLVGKRQAHSMYRNVYKYDMNNSLTTLPFPPRGDMWSINHPLVHSTKNSRPNRNVLWCLGAFTCSCSGQLKIVATHRHMWNHEQTATNQVTKIVQRLLSRFWIGNITECIWNALLLSFNSMWLWWIEHLPLCSYVERRLVESNRIV